MKIAQISQLTCSMYKTGRDITPKSKSPDEKEKKRYEF